MKGEMKGAMSHHMSFTLDITKPLFIKISLCVCYGVAWRGVVWRGVVWCGVVWCGVVWCGVAWHGVA